MKSVTTLHSLELHAASKVKIDKWIGYRCDRKESPYGFYFEITGAVCPAYKQGEKKGQTNYSKADKATERTITFTPQEHDDFVQNWEVLNKLCMKCKGKGSAATAWNSTKGAYNYRECDRCHGTGKNQVVSEA
mgnify:CR=1 FL=1